MKKEFIINIVLVAAFGSSYSIADDIGAGRPPPAATDPLPMETESSWWNELLELFEFESE